MLERMFFEAEKNNYYVRLLIISFLITVVFSIVNYIIGGNSLFLVAFVSIALSYPIVSYIREMDEYEIEKQLSSKNLLKRHEKELTVFWAIFLGVTFGFLATNSIILDYTYQERFVNSLSGNVVNHTSFFMQILTNNLEVGFFTFLISFLVFGGLIFILVWNISIISYYLHSLGSFENALIVGISILPHGLLEIGGYVFAGIAGSVLAYRVDRKIKFNHKLNDEFMKDLSILIIFSIVFIFIGAIVEVL